jgi:hypothetical protein
VTYDDWKTTDDTPQPQCDQPATVTRGRMAWCAEHDPEQCGKRFSYNNGSANAMDGHHNIIDRCRKPKGHRGDHWNEARRD